MLSGWPDVRLNLGAPLPWSQARARIFIFSFLLLLHECSPWFLMFYTYMYVYLIKSIILTFYVMDWVEFKWKFMNRYLFIHTILSGWKLMLCMMCEICLWMMNGVEWWSRHSIFRKGDTDVHCLWIWSIRRYHDSIGTLESYRWITR